MPRPDFPRTIMEFQRRFTDDAACRDYLFACRWPDGFRCPACGFEHAYEVASRFLWQFAHCHHQISITAGTVLHKTRTPIHLWFWAAYLTSTGTPGISALQLQRQLGLKRYETAWMMLHKLRRAMVAPERSPLTGLIEVDDAYIGGTGLRSTRRSRCFRRRHNRDRCRGGPGKQVREAPDGGCGRPLG